MNLEEKLTHLAVVVALVLAVLGGADAPVGDMLGALPSLVIDARFCAEHICVEI